MELTDEQRAIVEAGDIDLAVSAGAGSGKTHVLVERYVRLLRTCAIPEIVAVTFTEVTAAEMRQRVRSEVLLRDHLAAHRATLDEAIIGTIHALCLRLLRDHPIEAGWDPGATVLPEDESIALRHLACVEAIDDAAVCGDERTLALGEIGPWALGQLLPPMVAARDEVARAFAVTLDGDGPSMIEERLTTARAELLDPLRERVAKTMAWVREQCIDPKDRLAQVCDAAMLAFGDPAGGDVGEWGERLAAGASLIDLRPGARGGWAIPVADVKAELRGLREAIRSALANAPEWNEHDEVMLEVLPGLRALFHDACARYRAAKHERLAVDFLDLELEAVRLIEEHPEVVEAWRRRRRHLMVDEAQDVSPIQARLIRGMLGEGADRPRLFLVGDEKQSIYQFRGADVRQFSQLRDLVRQWEGEVLPLSRSFRTHDGLIERCNQLFARTFELSGGVTMQALTGRPSELPVAPHLVITPLATVQNVAEESRLRREVEAAAVAAEIEELLTGDCLVWDKSARGYRSAAPGDIAILLRRYTNVHLYEQALEARGIPYATPSGSGFFDRQEILDLSNLLRWLAEPEDEIALVAILRSPFFILGDDTLLALRNAGGPFLNVLADPPASIEDDERERCRFAAETLGALATLARTASAIELLDEALTRTGFEATWAAISGGEQAVANIRKCARIVATLGGFSLTSVAAYLEQRREDTEAREAPAVLDRPEAVQLMTVHGAKGLEFPIVFVPECHLTAQPGNDPIRWRANDGIAFTFERTDEEESRPRPGFYAWLRLLDERDEEDEHMRLFYVAATRAGDYLYLSGDERGGGSWLRAALGAINDGVLTDVDLRDALPPDRSLVRRRAPRVLEAPAAFEDYTPPLLAAPPVIPLRTSTPATALRVHHSPRYAHGDGLALVRGTVTHRALDVAYSTGGSPDIGALIHAEAPDLDAATVAALIGEVSAMLEAFRTSEMGSALHALDAEARFELSFAWDWEGVPVHGQVDLVYRAAGEWHVVDFKSDSLEGRTPAEAAAPYLVQIGLYARAIEAATGERPRAGLYFLRTGTWYQPPWDEIEEALAVARAGIDSGLRLTPDDDFELAAESLSLSM